MISRRKRRKRRNPFESRKRRNIVLASMALAMITGYLLADYLNGLPVDAVATYVGRDSCIDCHVQQAKLFHGSHHDLAMDLATEASVLGNFDDQKIEHYGITSHLYRSGDRFMVHTEGPDGEMHDYEVKYVFGVEPLQQYMVELEPAAALTEVSGTAADSGEPMTRAGRVQVLRLSWDVPGQRWFYLDPPDVKEKLEPDDPLHWTSETQNWNVTCAECHSTNVQQHFDPANNSMVTSFSEIDVSCEACHGPGSLHVQMANQTSLFWDRHHGYGLARLKTTANISQVEMCAVCHSRRSVIEGDYQPGCRFDDYFALQMLQTPIYHADGQIRDEDYVYGSFLQSKMYHNNIRCSDCHDPHSARLKHQGNLVCTSCHQHPSGKYDSISHHHHEPGTAGAMCVECHMPHTTYMAVDDRRDHSFRVPRPDLSVKLKTPNACSACHLRLELEKAEGQPAVEGQYLNWILAAEQGDAAATEMLSRIDQQMLDATEKWYSATPAVPETKYYEDLAFGLTDSVEGNESESHLIGLARDPKVPAIIRASSVIELATSTASESRQVITDSVDDRSPMVAAAAVQSLAPAVSEWLGQLQTTQRAEAGRKLQKLLQQVMPLLQHESGSVRIATMRFAMNLPASLIEQFATPEQRQAFRDGLNDLEKSLKLGSNRASGQMVLGDYYLRTGRIDDAKQAYVYAIRMDESLAGPRSNLARLLEQEVASFQQQLQSLAGSGAAESAISGMQKKLMAVQHQIDSLRKAEHERLKRDVEKVAGLPDNHVVHYRLAMSSLLQRDFELAEEHLQECLRQQPDDPLYLYAAGTFYLETGKLQRAAKLAVRLKKVAPGDAGGQQLADAIRNAMERRKLDQDQE